MMTELAPLVGAGALLVLAAAAAGFTAGRCGRSRVPAPDLSTFTRAEARPAPPRPPEWTVPGPWTHHRDAVIIPIDVALLAAIPRDLQRAYADHRRVAGIAALIAEHGQEEPIQIVVDIAGRCVIRDGHHRLVATTSLGRGCLAAIFDPVPHRIEGYARPSAQLLSSLARCALPRPEPAASTPAGSGGPASAAGAPR